jgi:hypothetical protein
MFKVENSSSLPSEPEAKKTLEINIFYVLLEQKTAVKRFKRVMIEFAFVNRCKISFKLRKLFNQTYTHFLRDYHGYFCSNEYLSTFYLMILSSVADLDPVPFLNLHPGSGIVFFRIRDPKQIFLIA